MAAGAPDRERISGSTAASSPASRLRASTGGARRATTISMCASRNGRPRIRFGSGPTVRPRWHSRRRWRATASCTARWSWRLRLPRSWSRAASASASQASCARPAAATSSSGWRRRSCTIKASARACRRLSRPPRSPRSCSSRTFGARSPTCGARSRSFPVAAHAATSCRSSIPPRRHSRIGAASSSSSRKAAAASPPAVPRLGGPTTRHACAATAREIRSETDRLGWSFTIHRTDRPASELLLSLHVRIGTGLADGGTRTYASTEQRIPA